jgi:hypothetical protein
VKLADVAVAGLTGDEVIAGAGGAEAAKAALTR